MENVTNVTNFEEFVAAVRQVAGQSERALTFVGFMFAIALLTQAIGTAVLFCAGMLKAPNSESDSTRLMADRVGAATIDVHVPDSDPSTAMDVAPEAAEAAQAVQPTSTLEALPWVKHRTWYVVAAFSATYLLCVAAAAASLATNQLSPEHGLSWEVYTGLFSCGCVWLLTQAVLAAIRLPAGRHYGMLSFTEAMISGVCPFVSDSFDTMKDILFAFLCFAAEDAFVQALGALTLIWLVTFHIVLLRDKNCQLEIASNHLAVLSLPTFPADSTDSGKKAIKTEVTWMEWAFSKASGMWSELLPLLYKQFTPTKRKMLLWENVPQAALAILYLVLVPGGSTVVALLNLAVPIVQVTLAFVLFKPLQRRIAPKIANKLDVALQASDGDQVIRLKDEAGLEEDSELFREICASSRLLKEIDDIIQDDSTREGRMSSTDAWRASWSFCAGWFAALSQQEWDLSEKLEGKENLFKAMLKMVSFNLDHLKRLKLNSNQIPSSWAEELAKKFSGNQTLIRLEMGGNALGAGGLKALARSIPSTHIEELVLDGNGCGDDGAQVLGTMLAGLSPNHSFRELSLRRNQFGDDGAKAIARGLKGQKSLRALILDENEIGDDGGEALGDALDGSELQTLHIQLNKLGDRGCKALEEAQQRSKTLVDFCIDDNEAWAAEESSLQETATLTGHREVVRQAIRTGAATAVTCSWDRTLRVWDLMTGTCTATLTGHSDRVLALCIIDLCTVASGGGSGEVKLWDLRSARCKATIATGHVHVTALCRGDGQIATGGSDGTIRFWEVASGRCVCTLRGHGSDVNAVRRVTATLLASASLDGTIKVWDRRTEQCLATLKGHEGGVFALVRLSHGSVASGGTDQTVKVWCLETAACRLTLTGHGGAVCALARLGSRTLASGGNQTIRLWNLVTGACNQVLDGHGASVCALVRMDAATLVSGGSDGSGVLKVWRSEATPKEQLPNDSQK